MYEDKDKEDEGEDMSEAQKICYIRASSKSRSMHSGDAVSSRYQEETQVHSASTRCVNPDDIPVEVGRHEVEAGNDPVLNQTLRNLSSFPTRLGPITPSRHLGESLKD